MIMRKTILFGIFGLFALLITGCTSDNQTKTTLEKAGYTNIEISGWDALGCSDDDWYSTKFIATNPKDERIEGTVCCGLIFKKCTIRY